MLVRETLSPRTLLAVAALLALHAVLAIWGAAGKSVTHDEILHVTGGYSYWRFDDYRLHPENGILPQRWAALPALVHAPPFPELEGNPYWKGSESAPLGHAFFYEGGVDHFPTLMAGRVMIVLFNVATGTLIFAWSRRLFGLTGAFVSLGLFVFSPNFLAHGALATSDACMTFFFLASVGAWWRHLHGGGDGAWWLSALVFGLACVAKFSAPLLLPMFALLALARVWHAEPLRLWGWRFESPAGRALAIVLSALGHGAVAVAVIWAFYGFRFAAFNPELVPTGHFIRDWDVLDLHLGLTGKIIRGLADLHALPEAFLYGLAYVLETAQVRSAYLNGEYSVTGWTSFFPWAFALKTTLPVLAVCGLVPVLAARRWRGDRERLKGDLYRVAPLVTLFVVYWIFSLTSHLNIGHRHILPTYPVLFIAAGALGPWVAARSRAAAVAVIALVGAQAVEAARIAPHYLAYFNPLGGGPANGHRHLVDSSLDWGQDLPGLARWLEENAPTGEPVYISYFGTGEPAYYGIRARRLTMINGFKIPQPYVPLEPGVYAISATSLSHVYSPVRGAWTLEFEQEYQQLHAIEPELRAFETDAVRREELIRSAPQQNWDHAISRYQLLRFARLCHYLRVRTPEAEIGYSIFIYRLTAEEIAAATDGSLADWRTLIERAVLTPTSK